MFEPISVVLQFGFLVVLYLFILWIVQAAVRDVRATSRRDVDPVDLRSKVHRAAPKKESHADNGKLVVKKGKGLKTGDTYKVGSGLTIGRSSACNIRIDDPFASHRHVRILVTASGVYAEDLDSTNGTFLNKKPLRGSQELKNGSVIKIGETQLRYESA